MPTARQMTPVMDQLMQRWLANLDREADLVDLDRAYARKVSLLLGSAAGEDDVAAAIALTAGYETLRSRRTSAAEPTHSI